MSSVKKTIILAAVILAATLACATLVADEDYAATDTLTVTDAETGNALTVDGDGIHGVVVADAGGDYAIRIVIPATGYVSYQDDMFHSVAASAGSAVIELAVDEESASFSYAITAAEQTSLEGLALTSIALDLTFDDGAAKVITWSVDGIVIGITDTDARVIPVAPSKEHYVLAGWAVDDAVVITYNAGLPGDGYVLAESLITSAITDVDTYLASLAEDTTFSASFEPVMQTVTLKAGEETIGTITAPYGTTIVEPRLPDGFKAWDFDFSTPITGDITIAAIEDDAPVIPAWTVAFVVDGEIIATFTSDKETIVITVPSDPSKEGYEFQGWAIGTQLIADPTTYDYNESSTVLTALFKAVEIVEHTVTFVSGGEVVAEVKVIDGEAVIAPEAPEGCFWLYDGAPITKDTTIEAKPVTVTVTFVVGKDVFTAYTQTIPYGEKIDAEKLAAFVFPSGYSGWDFDMDTPIYEDTQIKAKEIAEEPGFFSTALGKCVGIIIGFVLVTFVYLLLTKRITIPMLSRSKTAASEDPKDPPRMEE